MKGFLKKHVPYFQASPLKSSRYHMPSPDICSSPTEDGPLLSILEKLEKKEFIFPPLPEIAIRVLALAQNPDAHAIPLSTLI